MIAFGKYQPDLVGGLDNCDGLIPLNGKYLPLASLSVYAPYTVEGSPLAIQYFKAANGLSYIFIGCTKKLYRIDGNFPTDVSKAGGYLTPTTATWNFTAYGTSGLASNNHAPIQQISTLASGTFADLAGTPPLARCICMFKDQLFLGNTTESATNYPRRVFRSAQGDITDWAVDSATGCGFYDLPSWGQEVTGLTVNGDYLFVYLNNAIWMLSFIGPPLWYSYNKIYEGTCATAQGCIANIGNMQNLVLTPTDVLRVSGTTVTSIGYGIRSFLNNITHSQYLRNRITNTIDQTRKLVIWSMVSKENAGSTPDKLLIYNYEEDRFSIANSYSASCVGLKAEDSCVAVDPSYYLSTFTGSPVNSVIEISEEDMGDVFLVNQVVPHIDTLSGTLTTTVKSRYSLNNSYKSTQSTMNSKGICNLRASGKYMKARFNVTGNHAGLSGYTPTLIKRGRR